MLVSGRGRVLWTNGSAAIVHAPEEHLACVVGVAPWAALETAFDRLGPDDEVVISYEDAAAAGFASGTWTAEPAIVHIRREECPLPGIGRWPVRVYDMRHRPDLAHVPATLRHELEQALRFTPLVAACDGDLPVAFCYAGWETERWWDVSIDTLAEWRGRGFALAAAATLIDRMRASGKRAVWGALDSNLESRGLAARLGFVQVARLFVLCRVKP